MNVKSIRTFVSNKVDFVIVGFTDFYVVTTVQKVKIYDILVQLIIVDFAARFYAVSESQIDGVILFVRGKKFLTLNIVTLCAIHDHRFFNVVDIGDYRFYRCVDAFLL